MSPTQLLAKVLQIAAGAVLAIGLVLCVLQFSPAPPSPAAPPAPGADVQGQAPSAIVPALVYLMLGVGLAGMLLGLAANLLRRSELPPELTATLGGLGRSVQELQSQVAQLAQVAAPRPEAATPPAPASPGIQEDQSSQAPPRILEALEEIRQLCLLPDSERQVRFRQQLEQRKLTTLEQVRRHAQEQQWAAADRLLSELQRQFPADPQVTQARSTFEQGRAAAAEAAYRNTRKQIEDLMAISSWDQAIQQARAFAASFPQYPKATELLAFVTRERDVFREGAVQRMIDEIRDEGERRSWRRALTAAQRLLSQFPDHPKCHAIRQQIKIIQENAEVEEQREGKARIQELLRGKRYDEAIELAEDLVRRFPASPTAQSLQAELLPRLRAAASSGQQTTDYPLQ